MFPVISILSLLWAGLAGPPAGEPAYVGSAACGKCHAGQHRQWTQSLHSRMIQKADQTSVLGDFSRNNTLVHGHTRFEMTAREGAYWVREVGPDGKETRFRVDYTLGSKRTQHYLSRLADGRMRVVFPTWDAQKREWFHSSEIIPTGHHAEVSIQVWNQHCYNCHVSQERQGFDLETNTYHTTFTETGINCEMCHGPGSAHAERMAADPGAADRQIVNPKKLPPRRQVLVCVQCHTPRIIVAHGFHPGKNYYDYYMPTLMHFYIERWYDPPMWADGRMRRFATEGAALWQSKCYLKGEATCTSCHNPHLNTIRRDPRFRDSDVLCAGCHRDYAAQAKVAAHTRHPLRSEGSRCIACHMPATTNMIKDHERDHTISIPVPENTSLYQIPNACNTCHADRAPEWSAGWMDRWYPARPKPNLRRARAFTLARRRSPASVELLVELLRDARESTVVRGSAAGFLGEFPGEKVAEPLIEALGDPDVMARAEAARSLSEARSPRAVEPLRRALADPNRIVRLNAVFALVKMGMLSVDGPDADAFQKAKQEYLEFLQAFPDVYGIRVDLGTYYALHHEYAGALAEYRNAAKLRDDLPLAHYYIGVTCAQMGEFEPALRSFERTLALDPG
ncbi:MAG: hypothetical protein DMG07_11745, partial [Acidobacteria bacterium]